MCGIAGIYTNNQNSKIPMKSLKNILAFIQHRGPDQSGIYRDHQCGLVNARLSIIDIAGGQQPISNEDHRYWIIFNGEIFNYKELRTSLEQNGHIFKTQTDTEVILHLYEIYGSQCLQMLNGQFAIAIWDSHQKSLFLARDRFGIRPLFYTAINDQFAFSSEIKAFLALDSWQPAINQQSLADTFTYWAPRKGNTIFDQVFEIPPAHFMVIKDGQYKLTQYWEMDFTPNDLLHNEYEVQEQFESLLINAAKIRLRADVPVGAYLSGGLDSSTVTAIIQGFSDTPVETFSIRFSTTRFDERQYQDKLNQYLNINHHEITCSPAEIGDIFPEVIWHTETPILRTSPAPMYLLSKLVHQHQYKVVLTGEGADEIFAGYDIFKEDYIRRFVARNPGSTKRSRMFQTLYPEIAHTNRNNNFLEAFFQRDIENTDAPFYTHHLRWSNTGRTKRFLTLVEDNVFSPYTYPVSLPEEFHHWSALAKMQYLEIQTFMSPYLLSSQGDRMAMANSVEGRYPFLDVELVEFANQLPDHLKLRGLQEKRILRQFARKLVPKEIWQRRKRPYRAPILESFFSENETPDYVKELLYPKMITQTGYFKEKAVSMLINKARERKVLSEIEEMALVGIISTQLIHWLFIQGNFPYPMILTKEPIKIIDMMNVSI